MDRAYESHAVDQAPPAPEVLSKGYPTSGNPMTGQRATRPGPWWYHMVTEELVKVIAAAGVAPDAKNTSQLIGALKALFAGRLSHEELAAAFTGHVEGADPHSQYMTQSETDGLIRSFFVSERAGVEGGEDWNAVENTRPGVGALLLNGTDANGPPVGNVYFHALNICFPSTSGATDNVTQIAIPYSSPCEDIFFRGRYEGEWTLWRRVWTNLNLDPSLIAPPVGSIIWVPYASPPAGYLKANGATLSRAVYASLFAAIGTTYGAGDGASTFLIPDLRGEFVRGWDDSRGIDAQRLLGSAQSDAFRSHAHRLPQLGGGSNSSEGIATGINYNGSFRNTDETGDPETRPRNIALLACIKY